MKRFSNQDITFLAEGALGRRCRGHCTIAAKASCSRRNCACSRAATSRSSGWSAPTTSTRKRSSRSSSQTIPARPACSQVAAGQDFGAGRTAREVLRRGAEIDLRAGQLRPHRAMDGRRRRALSRGRPDRLRRCSGRLPGRRPDRTPRPAAAATTYDEINPSAYVRFEPSDALTLYAQAARGFRSGQVNQPLPDTVPGRSAGARRWARSPIQTRCGTTSSARSRSSPMAASGSTQPSIARNGRACSSASRSTAASAAASTAATSTSDGVELEFVAQPVDAWRFNVAVSFNNSEFDSVVPGAELRRRRAPAGRAGAQRQRRRAVQLQPRQLPGRVSSVPTTYTSAMFG